MTLKDLTVKEVLDNPQAVAVLNELAPSLMKLPVLKLLTKKNCGEIFDRVVNKKLLPKETADEIARRIEALYN